MNIFKTLKRLGKNKEEGPPVLTIKFSENELNLECHICQIIEKFPGNYTNTINDIPVPNWAAKKIIEDFCNNHEHKQVTF